MMNQNNNKWNIHQTKRGFEFICFKDQYGHACSLQQSSAIDDTNKETKNPGSSYVWLGKDDSFESNMLSDRMYLSKDHVRKLIRYLQNWLDNGSFVINE